jgi:FkbM family methyltransferase
MTLTRRIIRFLNSLLASKPNTPIGSGILCVIARNHGGLYCVPAASIHRKVAQYILHGRVYEPDTIDFICRNVGSGDIVHAGAYFGDFLPAISKAASGIVWAFEPNSENHRCAEITLRLNSLQNVRLHPFGLSDQAGLVPMLVRDSDGTSRGGSSHISAQAIKGRTEPVWTVRLDDVIPSEAHVSIIQLDVEGHEGQAVRGALRTIERCRPILILESVPSEPWFEALLARLHYKKTGTAHRNTIFRSASG